jgi:tetratricopeptide (TPR) repeat protein
MAPITASSSRTPKAILTLSAGALTALVAATATSAQTIHQRTPAQWLVDLGRAYGLSPKAAPTDADATVILTLLQAAARVDPKLADAYYWQLDLLPGLGRGQDVPDILERYVEAAPQDRVAQLNHLDNRLDVVQTLEQRIEYCATYLKKPHLPAEVISDLHRRIGELHYNQGDLESARTRIQTALDTFPLNVAAHRLAYQLDENLDDQEARVRFALDVVAANPSRTMAVWELAKTLDDLSLHAEAQEWYAYAAEMFTYANPGQRPPAPFLTDLAESQLDGGKPEAAQKTCNLAIERDLTYERARLLMFHIAEAVNNKELARAQLDTLRNHYVTIASIVQKRQDAQQAARMAWFYEAYWKSAEHSAVFAEIAAPLVNDTYAQRAIGWAALTNDKFEEARDRLAPLAESDQMAAVGLARALTGLKRNDEAIAVLQKAANIRRTGAAFNMVASGLKQLSAELPPEPDRQPIKDVLDRFDRRSLDFFRQPNAYLSLDMTTPTPTIDPGLPWHVNIKLKNIGPFTVTLGRELMAQPRVLVSAHVVGDQSRQFKHYLSLSMNRRQALLPGEVIEIDTTVDVGPIQEMMFVTPQVSHEVTFSLLLDPVRSNKDWTHRLGGFSVKPLRITRRNLGVTPARVDEFIGEAQSQTTARRLLAVKLLAGLLAEHERLADGRLAYPAQPVDAGRIKHALIERLNDPAPMVRAAVLDALRFVTLDGPTLGKVAPLLSDSHWLPRMLAVFSLTQTQGESFSRVVDKLADSDPDPLVKQLAAAFREGRGSRPSGS